MFVGGCMEDYLRLVPVEDKADGRSVAHIAQKLGNTYRGEFFLDLKTYRIQVKLILFNQNNFFWIQASNLAAQFTANRPASTGDKHLRIANHPPH